MSRRKEDLLRITVEALRSEGFLPAECFSGVLAGWLKGGSRFFVVTGHPQLSNDVEILLYLGTGFVGAFSIRSADSIAVIRDPRRCGRGQKPKWRIPAKGRGEDRLRSEIVSSIISVLVEADFGEE